MSKTNLIRHRVVSDWELRERLRKDLDLTPYQSRKLSDVIDDLPWKLIGFEKRVPVFWMWRLTAIFLVMFLLLAWIIYPFNWLITGQGGYGVKSWVGKLYVNWSKKLGWD